METIDIRKALRLKIRQEFEACPAESYPHFNKMVQTRNGYLKAEELVINFAISNNLPVSTSIAQLEMELG